jgi:hypothetical protein
MKATAKQQSSSAKYLLVKTINGRLVSDEVLVVQMLCRLVVGGVFPGR